MKTRLSLLSLLLIVFTMTVFAYTAQFHTGPGLVAGESSSDFSRTEPSGDGQGLNLPNAPVLTSCEGWEFAGWMLRGAPYGPTDELTQEIYRAGELYRLSSVSEEFYAVYRYKTDRYCEIYVKDQLITGAQYIVVNEIDYQKGKNSIRYPVILPAANSISGISIRTAYSTWGDGYIDINSSNQLTEAQRQSIIYVMSESNATNHYWSLYNPYTSYFLDFENLKGISAYSTNADAIITRSDWNKFTFAGANSGYQIGFYEDPDRYRGFHENFFVLRQQTIFSSTPNCSAPNYTVTLIPGSHGTCSSATLTESGFHRGVELPAATPTPGEGCDDLWEFAGWTESGGFLNPDDATELTKRLWLNGEIYYPEKNLETLYAVYRRKSTTWEQVEDPNTLQAGEKVLIAYKNGSDYYVLSSAQQAAGYNKVISVTGGGITTLDNAAAVWTLEGKKGAWRLKDSNNKHLDMTRSDYAYSYTYPWSRWSDEFTISGENDLSIRSNYADKRYLTANATRFSSSTTANSNIHIYRQVTTYSKNPQCDAYTVIFNSGEGTFENTGTNANITVSNVSSRTGMVLGDAPVATPPDCDNWQFAGWRVGSGLNSTTAAPGVLYTIYDTYIPLQDNITLYAVYQKGSGTITYERISTSSEVVNGGTYIIGGYGNNFSGKAVTNSYNNNTWAWANITVNNGVISNVNNNSILWTFNGTYFVDNNNQPLAYNRNANYYFYLKNVDSPFYLEEHGNTTYHLYMSSNNSKVCMDNDGEYNTRWSDYYQFYIYRQKSTASEYNSWPHCTPFHVVLNSCGGKFSEIGDTQTLEETNRTSGVSLSGHTPTNSCGWNLVGWVEKKPIQARNSEPVGLISKTTTYHPKQDMDQLYAVYKKADENLWSSYPACGSGIEVVEWAADSIVVETYLSLSGTPTLNGKSGGSNTDGTYYLKYDVISNPCTPLLIEWGGVTQIVKTPLLVTNYTRTSAVTNGITNCNTCDMVVLNGATAVVDGNKTVRDITVYPGGRFNLPSGQTFGASSLTMRTIGDELAPVALIQGNFTCPMLNHDRRIDNTRYYWMALPYDVAITNINYADATANGKNAAYDTDYYLKFYDGVARAADKGSKSTYWTHIADVDGFELSTAVLNAGRGYLIGLPKTAQNSTGHKYRTFRFPMSMMGGTAWDSEKTINKTVVATGANCDWPQHVGWNMIGNPFLQNYSAVSVSDVSCGKLTEYHDPETGAWVSPWYTLEEGTTDVPYISVYDPATDTYTQTKVKGQNLAPFSAAFVQLPSSVTGIHFSGTSISKNNAPARRMGLLNEEQTSEIEIGTMGYFDTEQFTLILDDQYSADYEVGADLLKMCNASKNNLYTHHNGTECVFDALSYADADSIPVGLKLPAATALTIGARRKQLSDDIEHVWLIDNETNSWTDLLYDTYTFTSESGTFNNRLWIRIINRYDTPTEIPCGASVNGDATYKFIQNGQLYIQRDNKLYNAVGVEIK